MANSTDTGKAPSPLTEAIKEAAYIERCPIGALTALAPANDPFRMDTETLRCDAQWLADAASNINGQIHLRGLHYAILSTIKPNGDVYINTDANWKWLSERAAKAARWLGLIDWERIVDHRNSAPVIHKGIEREAYTGVHAGALIELPSIESFTPRPFSLGQHGQPVHIVIFAEKSSPGPVLLPIAREIGADLYLGTGETSDTLIYQMASDAVADGRPMVLLTLADSDPAGWQMPISIARKLHALKIGWFPTLEYWVIRVGLNPDQVRQYDLPMTPLKDGEKRATAWKAATGTEQTELDALAALQPGVLDDMVRAAVAPWFDGTLEQRTQSAHNAWRRQADDVVTEHLDGDAVTALTDEIDATLTTFTTAMARMNGELRALASGIELPELELPAADLDQDGRASALVTSRWTFAQQSQALIDSKAYLDV